MFVIEEAQSQAYLADYRFFFFCFQLDLYNLEWQYWAHSTGKRFIHYTARNVFIFRRTNNDAKPEELIDKI